MVGRCAGRHGDRWASAYRQSVPQGNLSGRGEDRPKAEDRATIHRIMGEDAMRVVITGASRGIGRATALKLAADGAEALTLCDVAYLDELESLASNLRTAGCKVRTLKADMARPSEPAKLVAAAVKAMGGIDAIVGNAGITAPGKLVDLDIATSDRIFDINLRANWLLAKAAHPHLKRSKGAVVMLASMACIMPQIPT